LNFIILLILYSLKFRDFNLWVSYTLRVLKLLAKLSENKVETCAIALLKNISLWFTFVHCFEEIAERSEELNPAEIAEKCAKSLRIDYAPMEGCGSDPQGNELERKMALKANALKPQHQYVPWVTINGKHTEKMQLEAEDNLLELVCEFYTGTKPSACHRQQTGHSYKNETEEHLHFQLSLSLLRRGLLQSRRVETREGWEEGKIKARETRAPRPRFLSSALFFHWCILTGAATEERGFPWPCLLFPGS